MRVETFQNTTATRLYFKQRVQVNIKEHIKAPCITGPLWRESTDDLWIYSQMVRNAVRYGVSNYRSNPTVCSAACSS